MSNTTVMVRSSEISGPELRRGFESAIRDAIEAAGDDVVRMKYEALQAEAALRLREAQSKFDGYLRARPKDLQAWTDYPYVSKKLRDAAAVRRSVAECLELAAQDPMIAWDVGVDLVQIDATAEAAEQFQSALDLNPGDVSVQYQAHRALLWAGRMEQAERLEQALLASDMAEIYLSNVRLRAACARGNRQAAEAALSSKPASDLYGRWHGLTLLGRREEAAAVLMPLDATERGRDDLAGYMMYSQFDPARYPNLSAILERRGIARREPTPIPFACPAA